MTFFSLPYWEVFLIHKKFYTPCPPHSFLCPPILIWSAKRTQAFSFSFFATETASYSQLCRERNDRVMPNKCLYRSLVRKKTHLSSYLHCARSTLHLSITWYPEECLTLTLGPYVDRRMFIHLFSCHMQDPLIIYIFDFGLFLC